VDPPSELTCVRSSPETGAGTSRTSDAGQGTLVALLSIMLAPVRSRPSWPQCAVRAGEPTRGLARLAAATFAIALGLVATPARAETGRLMVDWSQFADVLRLGTVALEREGGFHLGEDERPASLRAPEDMPWVGSSPRWGIIARDWGGARGLLGGLSLMDRLRPIRSRRMLVTRVRVTDGRVTPFLQMGLGQWRIDTDLMPALRRDVETAGQLGGGIEVSFGAATIALEADDTMLYRERHDARQVCQPNVWNSLLAARVEF